MINLVNTVLGKIHRWTVLQIDVLICSFSLLLSFALRFNFDIPDPVWYKMPTVFLTVLISKILFFYVTRSYSGIIRFSGVDDAKRIFKALSYGLILVLGFNAIHIFLTDNILIPFSVLIIDYFTSLVFMAAFRITAKILYFEYKGLNNKKINVVIYGAGDAGIITKKTLSQDVALNYTVVAFVDDNPSKEKSTIEGVKIYSAETHLRKIIKEKQVDLVIIAIQNIDFNRKKDIINHCLSLGITVRSVPPVDRWINGELSSNQIRDVKIEDVLGRDPINLSNPEIKNEIQNKVILVTGAAGSIGSELARQIVRYSPSKVILLDQAESPLYDLELELSEIPLKINFETVLADVRNKERMEQVFLTFKPQIIFHAAAYKHVPVMEENPFEAVWTNVYGTKLLADLSIKYKALKFVMVSTDKAVNPSNVMGASKRIAEIYTQTLNSVFQNTSETGFITTRFGNVLGSNGSVIPRFRKQIAEGGPVTITHPEITRYFMTIPEACQLVLEAGVMGKGGEIFLFDMGRSIKIVDLAKKMIRLSGLTLGKDIQIMFTGLRPGEKLYEELLNDKENTTKTHHPKIMIAKVRECKFDEVNKDINQLLTLLKEFNNEKLILQMKKIVPEFKSNNSVYEKLDKELSGKPTPTIA